MEKYNAEALETITQKVVELLFPMVEQASHIGEIEQTLRRLLQMVGQASLKRLLEQGGQPQSKEPAHVAACRITASSERQR